MIEELLRTRRSIRRFKPDPVPREMIERLLAAAITAPSASNKQPWRFLVITKRSLIESLATEVRGAVERIARNITPASEAAFRLYGDYFTRFENAPVVIVTICRASTLLSDLVAPTLADDDRARISAMEHTSGLVGAALAIENLLLCAHALGLGASGMTGPLVAADRFAELLRVPASWQLVAVVPVGYPDEAPEPPARKSLDAVTRWFE